MEEKMIEVTLVRSGITRPKTQQRTLRGLRLTRMNKTVRLKDTPEIRGMIRKVSHLVTVAEKQESEHEAK
ncbi:MAG TPA: 50S ribosomal protein L30 [Syntrophales bacterium]|jgi:large subunit ribosomal protein L30